MVRVFKTPKGVIGASLLAVLVIAGVGAEVFSPGDPFLQNIELVRLPPGSTDGKGNVFHLGTDHVGRDLLTRLLYGSRISLQVSASAVLLAGFLGCTLGLLAGFYGGWVDGLIMRAVDVQLAIPMVLVAIAWMAFFGPGIMSVIVIIGIWGWMQYARVVRGSVLSLKEADFITASRAVGAPNGWIMFRHLLPNLVGPVSVIATLQLGQAVLLESTLSFLGVGVPPPHATWGSMVADGRAYLDTAWWIAVVPGIAITLLVLGANLLGDALRDAVDPKTAPR